jgi:hypothetical protein
LWVRIIPELGNSLNEVGLDEIRDPLGRLLPELSLEFDFQNTIP